MSSGRTEQRYSQSKSSVRDEAKPLTEKDTRLGLSLSIYREDFHRPRRDEACRPAAGLGASFILSLPTLFLSSCLQALPLPNSSESTRAWPASLLPFWPLLAWGPPFSPPLATAPWGPGALPGVLPGSSLNAEPPLPRLHTLFPSPSPCLSQAPLHLGDSGRGRLALKQLRYLVVVGVRGARRSGEARPARGEGGQGPSRVLEKKCVRGPCRGGWGLPGPSPRRNGCRAAASPEAPGVAWPMRRSCFRCPILI